ncbi:MAG: RHS repeat-associated core domain-containing protein, partial [Eubacteriales bacterium]|nr:RHS repeat-associated core domain-containing protein [Eubacteriales bacterium]
MELNINGILDTAYSYGNERLTNERFTEWTGYYTYDARGSVSGVTDSEGMIWQSYRYDGFGNIIFGKPQYNNVYSYNAESYNPNMEAQYLRARYYSPETANFLTEDSWLGDITDPLTLNRYAYVKSSPLN